VTARLAVQLAALQRRLAEEEVDVPRKLDEAVARGSVARVGERAPQVRHAQAIRFERVVRQPDGRHGQLRRLERRPLFVLAHLERPLEHVRKAEPRAERGEMVGASGREPELRLRALGAEAVHRPPDPWHEVAPVVEVEVRNHDRVDPWPFLGLAQAGQHAGAAVEQQPPRPFDEVAGVGAAGVRPGRRAPDDFQPHRHILADAVARKIRVVIAKPGLDGHDRGAKIIARALRDAGMEVIYTGLHQTPEQIVETAIQEDADAVGISILSGAHMTLVPRILAGLKENGVDDVLVVVGGTIPGDDAKELKEQGVAEVFTPGAPTSQIVEFLKSKVPA
jgi:methylmalonyl-CoA mutase C-terminal domain/subunit